MFCYYQNRFLKRDRLTTHGFLCNPFLGWLDTVKGYKAKMKRTAGKVYHVLGRWLEEHPFKRLAEGIEAEQDFTHVRPSVIGDGRFPGHNTDTIIKGTCLVSSCSFFFLFYEINSTLSCTAFTCTTFSVALSGLNCKVWISFTVDGGV